MGNTEEQREDENDGQREKGLAEQRVGGAKNDAGMGRVGVGF